MINPNLILNENTDINEYCSSNPLHSKLYSNNFSMNDDEFSDIIISNCLSELLEGPDMASKIFNKNIISSNLFMENPWSIINNKNMVFKFREKIFPINVGLPIILSKLLYKKIYRKKQLKNYIRTHIILE